MSELPILCSVREANPPAGLGRDFARLSLLGGETPPPRHPSAHLLVHAPHAATMKTRTGTMFTGGVAALALALIGLVLYAFAVEPYWIEVTYHQIEAPIPSPLKIAHLADIHTQGFGNRERTLLRILERERPDLIVVSGDTVVDGGTYEMCRTVLSRLRAPLGVWVVRGNWENWRPVTNERAFYQSTGVNFLLNENRQIGNRNLWIVGLDDAMSGRPDLETALAGVPPQAFTIALFHSPAYFDRIAGRCHLAFAGHTHGGQIKFPWLGPLWLPAGCGRYLAGWYEQQGSRMYVNRGIGTSIIHARFLSRPEIAIITVGKDE